MKVLKFGGTSIGNTENIKKILDVIKSGKKEDKDLVIVVSAFSGVTDKLIHAAQSATQQNGYVAELKSLIKYHQDIVNEFVSGAQRKTVSKNVDAHFRELENILQGVSLTEDLSLRTLDAVMSFGERLSSYIIGEALNANKAKCTHIDTRELIKTNSYFGNARVLEKKTNSLIVDYFKNKKGIYIAGGFMAQDEDGVTTTIGRSGSDYTAAIFGAALGASEIQIWKTVDGVLSSDPHKVPDAFPLRHITYLEARELSYFGVKAVHLKTMIPAQTKKIPIRIKNILHPEDPGTVISTLNKKTRHHVKGVSPIKDVSIIRVQGNNTRYIAEMASRTFATLDHNNIDVILTTQASADPSMCIVIKRYDAKRAKELLEETFRLEIQTKNIQRITIENDKSVVAIIGQGMKGVPGISGRMFDALGKYGINVVAIAQGSSELNISAVIDKEDEVHALNVLHTEFFTHKAKPINAFVVGTGLIGGTMLNQISKARASLESEHGVRVRICGIANANNMLINTHHGLSLKDWEKHLEVGPLSNLNEFIKEMQDTKLPNKVFVDCTASEHVAGKYYDILDSKISIATPNKKAMSAKYKTYKELKELANKRDVSFMYETNVGAALPVINTLKDLAHNGDSVTKIEAVLSGTLSYIFNTFSSTDEKFSEIVKTAKEKGFTEPDPRDDLNGMDVARKILILAREAGSELEMKNIKMKAMLSKKCFSVKTVQDFFKELKKEDANFDKLRTELVKSGKVLRHIATFDAKSGKASVELKEVDSTHPFFNMSGSDNIVSISTKRYSDTPIVIKGPGAGAEVTAGGVFADIIKTVV